MSDVGDNDFIEYLDNFSKKNQVMRKEFIELIRNTNVQYVMGNMSSPNFACHDIIQTEVDKSNSSGTATSYGEWQQKHKINLEPELPDDDKELIKIETNINTISDLLDILDKYKYDDMYKYNIDLKSLSKVKDELQDINNLIGMETLKQNILDQLLYFIQKLHTFSDGDYKSSGHDQKHSHDRHCIRSLVEEKDLETVSDRYFKRAYDCNSSWLFALKRQGQTTQTKKPIRADEK